jgi:hypothetical protein
LPDRAGSCSVFTGRSLASQRQTVAARRTEPNCSTASMAAAPSRADRNSGRPLLSVVVVQIGGRYVGQLVFERFEGIMASHPYISGAGNIAEIIRVLRKNFPAIVNSDTVKKLGLAPNNESYVINALQFIGIIDEKGKRTDPLHT